MMNMLTMARPLCRLFRTVRLVLIAGLAMLTPALLFAASPDDCRIGSYLLDDGSDIDIAPSDGDTLRWRRFDGTTGALHPQADGTWVSTRGWSKATDGVIVSFAGCDTIRFGKASGTRRKFDVHEVVFHSHGTALAGRLVMPPGSDQVPVVVLLHGSETDSGLKYYSLQRMLPARGVGVFVYDKRGTGSSGGKYTQDFSLLADDAVAAVATARSLAGARLGRIGFQAGSQGGWVAPLAASRTPVDFAIVCFGLAVSVIDEDQESVELQLSEKGYSHREIRDALKVARAVENVVTSDFSSGYAQLNRLRSRYSKSRWYADLRGDYTWLFLPKSETELRAMAADFDWHTPFDYDPMPVLRSSHTPELWVLGGEDYEAPSQETRRRLNSLIVAGDDYTIAYYAKAAHGMTLFETDAAGERTDMRYAPGYFDLIRDFALYGALPGQYGDAELTRPRVVARGR